MVFSMRRLILKGFMLIALLGVVIAPWAAEAAQPTRSAKGKAKKAKARGNTEKPKAAKKTKVKKIQKTEAKSAETDNTKAIINYLKEAPLSRDEQTYSSADLVESYLAGAKSAKLAPKSVQAIAKRAKEELPPVDSSSSAPIKLDVETSQLEGEDNALQASDPSEGDAPVAESEEDPSDEDALQQSKLVKSKKRAKKGKAAIQNPKSIKGKQTLGAPKRIVLNVKTDGSVDVVMPPKAKRKAK